MDTYLFPIKSAVIAFIVLAWLITTPYLIFKYYKQGSLPMIQALIESSFVFYMIAAFFLTLLPLPSQEFVDSLTTARTQLIPFAFIRDFLKETVLVLGDSSTYFSALKQGVLIQPLFNIVMTIPFGIYLRYYFKKSFLFVVIASFSLSLFYEVTQLTGVYGLYSRSYRLFDVDDLMLNTLGGVIGYLITPGVVFLFPSRDKIESTIQIQSKKVTYLRRFVAYIVDQYVVTLFITIITFGVIQEGLLSGMIVTVLLSVMMIKFKGQTLGLWLVRLRVVSTTSDTLTSSQVFKRNSLFYLFIQLLSGFILQGFNTLNEFAYENVEVLIFYLVLMLAYFGVLAAHFVISMILKRRQFFYERASHTQIEPVIKN